MTMTRRLLVRRLVLQLLPLLLTLLSWVESFLGACLISDYIRLLHILHRAVNMWARGLTSVLVRQFLPLWLARFAVTVFCVRLEAGPSALIHLRDNSSS